MKKFYYLFVTCMIVVMGMFSSCNSCSKTEEPVIDNEEVVEPEVPVLNVEHTVAVDRETMYLNAGDNYRWFETCVLLPEYLDDENVTSDPVMVVNVFQSIVEVGNGADTWVYKFQHFADGTVLVDSVRGFWIEDNPLNDEEIDLSYAEAYERMMEVNYPKPHSQQVCLRKPIGPVACNAQYVFGNIREQIWIDAVTGDAKDSCPAFLETGFKMPLGEWP